MARGYRRVDRDQQFLLPPDMREWLPASDPVWLVIEAIERCDTSAFHVGRRVGGVGRAGYDPDMLVTLLVWAWLQGVHSSRLIERLCARDVSFRVICAGDAPDYSTICRFRQGFAAGVEQLFEQVLVLAARLGLGQLGVVALDGTKIAAPASAGQNRTGDGLRKAAATEQARQQARAAAREASRAHAEADAAEDARFGEGHGDQMSEEPAEDAGGDQEAEGDPAEKSGSGSGSGSVRRPGRSRSARIAEALAGLEEQVAQEQARQQLRVAAREARVAGNDGRPVEGRPPAGTEIVLAEEALAAARAAASARRQAWQPGRGRGRGRRPAEPDDQWQVRQAAARLARAHQTVARRAARQPGREPVANITDPESGLQPLAGGGWLQGYNAQAVTTDDGLIWATDVSSNPSDQITFIPMMTMAVATAERVGAGPIGLVLADAGYLTVDNLTEPGPDRLIAVGTRRSLEAAAHAAAEASEEASGGAVDPAVQAMRDRLASTDGIAGYRQRGRIAETTFGHAKHNLSFRRFTGIGLDRARTEWMFHAAVHNLSKIINRGPIAIQPAG